MPQHLQGDLFQMNGENRPGEVSELVDHLFRRKSGQIVAILTRIFGLENLQLAEDVVQDTLLQALKQWAYGGIPDNPGGWLMQVAKNRAIDVLRRQSIHRQKVEQTEREQQAEHELERTLDFEDSLGDDQLTLLFVGCHPALSPEMQIALLLKTLCGFGVSEIARAFLAPEATIAKRIVRAKRKIREQHLRFELPSDDEFLRRLDRVLAVLYLLFTEGYSASQGTSLVREDLCWEAIRLGDLLTNHRLGQRPRVHALLALMWLQVSRLSTRTTPEGDLLLLPEQDRARWDRQAIARGMVHLERSAAGAELTEYHLQAGIAACHAAAPTYAETDWSSVLYYYDQLAAINPSPIVALNRAVAVAMVHGPQAGLRALDQIEGLGNYYLLLATYGELAERCGQPEEAASYFRRALAGAANRVECGFLQKKLARLDGR